MTDDGENENLTARMEEIRIREFEIEKKHREIMEDELKAKLDNAIVDIKSSRDIPKSHPYDNLDLDFDVNDKDKELAKNADVKPNRRPLPRNDLLAEIPPDPVNFLREDGDETPKIEQGPTQRPLNKNRNNNRNRTDRRPERSNNEDEARPGDSPNRTRNQRPRPQQPPQQNRSQQDGNGPKRLPPSQLRTERRSAPIQIDQHATGPSQQNRQRRPNNRPPNKEGVDRNNITVQISGEVRSVKLKSPEKTYGTGRVGPRSETIQKFAVDTFNSENTADDRSPSDKHRNRRSNRRNPKPKEFQHPTLENIVVTKASVQDRLLKIVKDPVIKSETDAPAASPGTNGNTN